MRVTRRFCCQFAVLGLMLAACRTPPPDEQRLRDTLDALQTAAVEKRFSELLEHVADDYAGPAEAPTRADLERYLRFLGLRVQSLSASRIGTEIEMFPAQQRATARLTVLVRADAGGLMPDAREIVIDTAWKVDGGAWVLIQANWK